MKNRNALKNKYLNLNGSTFAIGREGSGLASARLKQDEHFKISRPYEAIPRGIALVNDLRVLSNAIGYVMGMRTKWDEFSPDERRFTPQVLAPNFHEVVKDSPRYAFDINDFESYAFALRLMIEEIVKFKPDLILVPMRGAIRPWLHLSVPTRMVDKGHLFQYTGVQQDNAGHVLREVLKPHQARDSKLLILDTADSGHGCRKLLKTLIDSHRLSDVWSVQCSLLFGKTHIPDRCYRMEAEMSTSNLKVVFKPYSCVRLIGEDKKDQIPSTRSGDAVVEYHQHSSTQKLWVPNLALYLDSMISASLHVGYESVYQIMAPLSQVDESGLPKGLVINELEMAI